MNQSDQGSKTTVTFRNRFLSAPLKGIDHPRTHLRRAFLFSNKTLRHGGLLTLLGLFLVVAVLILSSPGSAGAESVKPMYRATAANPGYTGIWDMPNARIIPDWEMRMGGSASYPWYYFHGGLGLFDHLEINGRITGIHGVSALSDNYGDYKDKSIDVKLQLLDDFDMWPAIAVGAMDIHGTGLFTSRYAVISKKIWMFDFTFGVGQGMLGGKSHAQRAKHKTHGQEYDYAGHYLVSYDADVRMFGGVEIAVLDNLWLSGEYSSIDYKTVKGGKKEKTPINVGVKYRLWDALDLKASLERGQYFAGGAYLQFPLSPEGILGWKKESLPIAEEKLAWAAFAADDKELADLMAVALRRDGFGDVKVIAARPNIWVEVENTRYISPVMALKRVHLVLQGLAPNWITDYYLVLTRNGIFQSGLHASRTHIQDFLDDKIDSKLFFKFADTSIYREEMWEKFQYKSAQDPMEVHKKDQIWSLGLNPHIGTYFNDPSGFAKISVNVGINGSLRPWKGGMFTSTYNIPIYNEISSSNPSLNESKAVSTDFMQYSSRKTCHFVSYGGDQIIELPWATRLRFSAGAFEAAYAGFSGEAYTSFWEGRLGAGVEGTIVWKRDKKNDFAIRGGYENEPYHTYFLNLYAKPFPSVGVELGLKIGRFLAGDPGVRIDLARNFRYFTLGGWYTITDTSIFDSSKNKDYNDKGIFISFPFSSFSDAPVFGWLYYAISPWTRDPGQVVSQFRTLYPFGKQQETPSEIKENFEVFKW